MKGLRNSVGFVIALSILLLNCFIPEYGVIAQSTSNETTVSTPTTVSDISITPQPTVTTSVYGQISYKTSVNLENKKVVMISTGSQHTLSLLDNGELWGWGRNQFGQVGNGNDREVTVPVKIMENIESVSAGYEHSAAISKDKDLYVWGENGFGQVGIKNVSNMVVTPTKIMGNVKYCSLGGAFSAAITENGELYLWGCGQNGRIGNGVFEGQTSPVKVLEGVKKVCLGYRHIIALKDNGDLIGWGANNFGQVGPELGLDISVPTKIFSNIKDIFAGGNTSFAIKDDGSLVMWGYPCDLSNTEMVYKPQTLDKDVKYATSSGSAIAYVKNNGDLYMRGDNACGKLGDGTEISTNSFKKIESKVKMVQTTSFNTFILLEIGCVMGCGTGGSGELGNGFLGYSIEPIYVTGNVRETRSYVYDNYIIKKNGELWAWGKLKELKAVSDNDIALVPVLLDNNVKQVAVGELFTAVLKDNGELWFRGRFLQGDEEHVSPVLIDTGVSKIEAGTYHLGYIKNKDELWMYGANMLGQLGVPKTEYVVPPFKLMSGIKDMAFSSESSYAVTQNGKLLSWGGNRQGQLGNGNKEDNYKPECILENMSCVYAACLNAAAIDVDGNMFTWGYNYDGQLGNGTFLDSPVPVKVARDVVLASVGSDNIYYIDRSGDLYRCGEIFGRSWSLTPYATKIMSGVKKVSAGFGKTAVIKNDDSLHLFGSNMYGELGNGYSSKYNPYLLRIMGTFLNRKVSGFIKPDFADNLTPKEINSGFVIENVETGIKTSTNAEGFFEMSLPGNFTKGTFKIVKNGYIERLIENIPICRDIQISSLVEPVRMWAGDFEENTEADKTVNISDVMKIAARFNKVSGQAGYNAQVDLNLDGAINLCDIMLLARNFGKISWQYRSLEECMIKYPTKF